MTAKTTIPPPPDFPAEWFSSWFDEDYLTLYQHRDSREAHLFLDKIRERFNKQGAKGTIDLACGAGRHSWILAEEFGWPVTGFDLSPTLLQRASKHETHITHNRPTFVRGDLRQLPFADCSCHLALSAFTSFGYFRTDDEHQETMKEVARILVPEGILILDLMNPAVAIETLVPEDESSTGQLHVKQTRQYSSDTRRITKTIELRNVDGNMRTVEECVRLFSPDEIDSMVNQAGLAVIERWGGYNAAPFDEQRSTRMISIAERIR